MLTKLISLAAETELPTPGLAIARRSISAGSEGLLQPVRRPLQRQIATATLNGARLAPPTLHHANSQASMLSFPSGRNSSASSRGDDVSQASVSPAGLLMAQLRTEFPNVMQNPDENEMVTFWSIFRLVSETMLDRGDRDILSKRDFWIHPDDTLLITNRNGHNHFMGFVLRCPEIVIRSAELIDPLSQDVATKRLKTPATVKEGLFQKNKDQFNRDMAQLLILYFHSERFRDAANLCIFNNNGCGDRTGSIYCLLKSMIPVYANSVLKEADLIPHYQRIYIIKQLAQLTMDIQKAHFGHDDDESGQIRWVLQRLSREMDLGIDHIAMSYQHSGESIEEYLGEIKRQLQQRLENFGYYEEMIENEDRYAHLRPRLTEIKSRLAIVRDNALDALLEKLALEEGHPDKINEDTFNTQAKAIEPGYEDSLRTEIRKLVAGAFLAGK